MKNYDKLKLILQDYNTLKNCDENLYLFSDPLQVAKKYKDPYISLICALFGYGNAKMIVKFLNSIDFNALNLEDDKIRHYFNKYKYKYRFQTSTDIAEIFITIKRLKDFDIEGVISCQPTDLNTINGVNNLIKKIYSLNSYKSPGYEFFFGRLFDKKPLSPYKRYNMFLRWMVRDSGIDLGLFKSIKKNQLIIPLDVHTHSISLALGLLDRKTYDFTSAFILTQNLKEFDPLDPVKYDFAIYRIGQERELDSIKEKYGI